MVLYYSAQFSFQRSNAVTWQLFTASIVYLPVLFVLMVLDRK
jgi:heme O synthase-like polyprenyltransferase